MPQAADHTEEATQAKELCEESTSGKLDLQ